MFYEPYFLGTERDPDNSCCSEDLLTPWLSQCYLISSSSEPSAHLFAVQREAFRRALLTRDNGLIPASTGDRSAIYHGRSSRSTVEIVRDPPFTSPLMLLVV